ncbi:MAG: hypothetical protein JNG89_00855 [Planctomycetaceae bacterium]|nr:hypothetical protein [Planctomycetaceae bacterium]
MNTLSVATADGRTEFHPGEQIEVELAWEFEEAPAAIELRLVWNTAGKGTTDLRVVQTERFDEPSPRDRCRKTLTLPGSPYSFSGKLVSIVWALELVALPQEDSERLEIVVGPNAREVQHADIVEDPV